MQFLLRMRRRVHGLAVFVINCPNSHLYIPAVRLHNLNPVSGPEFVLLSDHSISIFIRRGYDTQIRVVCDIGVAVIDLVLFGRLSVEEAGREPAERAVRDLLLIPGEIFLIERWIPGIVVDCLAIGAGNRRDIEGCFHSSLDLEAVNTGSHQIRDMFNHTQIL